MDRLKVKELAYKQKKFQLAKHEKDAEGKRKQLNEKQAAVDAANELHIEQNQQVASHGRKPSCKTLA